jgi:UDP-2,3-diacylglucosamine pyrophosphatase LpxH
VAGLLRTQMRGMHQLQRSRTLFLSDLHLATRACRAQVLLDFLQHNDAETIYLVGDVIDFWRVKRGAPWPPTHNEVVQTLLRKMRSGSRVVLIPGNHDEGSREFCGTALDGIEVLHESVHTTADGRRLLVVHGDEFDGVVRYAKWLAFMGDRGHGLVRRLKSPVQWVRRHLGFEAWSLSSYLKLKAKTAVNFIGKFEHELIEEARRRGVDGIVCGHIHHAASRSVGGIQYLNCGDWVESCTAITESGDGRLQIVCWLDVMRHRQPAETPTPRLQGAA